MSEHNAQQDASSHTAGDGVVNTANPGGPGKQVEYPDYLKQLEDLTTQIEKADTAEAIQALQKKFDDLQAEVAKKATKKSLSKKVSDLQKKLKDGDDGNGDGEGNQDEEAEGKKDGEGVEGAGEAETAEGGKKKAEAQHSFGKGLVAVDQLSPNALGNEYDWFKDLLKAHKKLVGFQ